MNMIFI